MKKVKTTELSLKFLLQNEEELPFEVGYLTFLFESKKRNFIKVILIDSKTLSEISEKEFLIWRHDSAKGSESLNSFVTTDETKRGKNSHEFTQNETEQKEQIRDAIRNFALKLPSDIGIKMKGKRMHYLMIIIYSNQNESKWVKEEIPKR